jgi:hypothetical protein
MLRNFNGMFCAADQTETPCGAQPVMIAKFPTGDGSFPKVILALSCPEYVQNALSPQKD